MKIGIIGCGHLGLALAESLLIYGKVKKDSLFVSCRGSEKSLLRIKQAFLEDNVKTNQEIVSKAHVVIITVRPNDLIELYGLSFRGNSLIISLVAGLSIKNLKKLLKVNNIFRGMTSGPSTIKSGKAVFF